MRHRPSSLPAAGTVLLCAGSLLAGDRLTYVDSSAGLLTPTMDSGRTEIEFGDLDGDGHVDMAMIGDHGSPYIGSGQHGVTVWFGDGAGHWSVFQYGDFGYGGIALGDVNHDGLMDVGYGMHHDYSDTDLGDQLLEVALGDGTGKYWTPWDDGLATSGESWGMFATDFADVDNDGDLDVGSISFGCCAGLHVYLNHGDGTWTQSWGFVGGNSSMEFSFGDVNGDGHADFAAAHGDGTVYFGDGTGGFTLADGDLPGGASWRSGISLGDANGDGRDDLSFTTAAEGLTVWSWVAAGHWQNLSGSLPASGDFEATQIVDMDLDGHGDLVAFATGEPGLLAVYGGDGAGNWSELAAVTTADNCGFAALRAGTDADHNGFPDVVFIAEENCSFWVGGTNRPHFYAESSTPSAPWVFPKSPRGGETLVAGSVRFIDWHAAVPGDQPATVDIDLSLLGPSGPWTALVTGLPNNGRYQWLLPAELPASSDCHLRFTLHVPGRSSTTTVTPGPFTILGQQVAATGDADGDGDVDLEDHAAFMACLTGPGGGLDPDCPVFDWNDDYDVDLEDAARFQGVFTGGQ